MVRRLPSKVTNQSKLSGWSRQIAAKGVSPEAFPLARGAEQRPRLWRKWAVRRLNEATSFASESAAKRLCRIARCSSERPHPSGYRRPPSPCARGKAFWCAASKEDNKSKVTQRVVKAGASAALLIRIAGLCRAGGENFRSRFPARGNFRSLRIFCPCAIGAQENPQPPMKVVRLSLVYKKSPLKVIRLSAASSGEKA